MTTDDKRDVPQRNHTLAAKVETLRQIDHILEEFEAELTILYFYRQTQKGQTAQASLDATFWEHGPSKSFKHFLQLRQLTPGSQNCLTGLVDEPDKFEFRLGEATDLFERITDKLYQQEEMDDRFAGFVDELYGAITDLRIVAGNALRVLSGRLTEPYHNDKFTFVRWFGQEYTFNLTQSRCIGILWRDWEDGRAGVHEDVIGEELGSNADKFRLRDQFKRHAAWKMMIHQKEADGRPTKGTHVLGPPPGD